MFKLLFTLTVFLVMALLLLGMRQQRLALTSETAKLHNEVLKREQKLWDQQDQIARQTNPLVLTEQIKNLGLEFSHPAPQVRTVRNGDGSMVVPPVRPRRRVSH